MHMDDHIHISILAALNGKNKKKETHTYKCIKLWKQMSKGDRRELKGKLSMDMLKMYMNISKNELIISLKIN